LIAQLWGRLSSGGPEPSRPPDRAAVVALLTVPLVLLAQRYFGEQPYYRGLHPDGSEWGALVWWSSAKILGFAVVPLLVALWLRVPFAELGLGLGDTARHFKIYLALYLMVLPLVVLVSSTPAFVETYPFYRGPRQLEWELLYGATFVSLELFFRGFILFALRRAIGAYALFVMMVPYVMIHFGKPLPEALGAVAAGLVLGAMALITRSIWGGVAVHLAVAWTMDFLALYKNG
jgi:membrane protease YdiL (CAAX protease family)